MFLKSGAQFWDHAFYVGLGVDGQDFGAELLDARFSMGWHRCKVSNKEHRVDTVKSVEL